MVIVTVEEESCPYGNLMHLNLKQQKMKCNFSEGKMKCNILKLLKTFET